MLEELILMFKRLRRKISRRKGVIVWVEGWGVVWGNNVRETTEGDLDD